MSYLDLSLDEDEFETVVPVNWHPNEKRQSISLDLTDLDDSAQGSSSSSSSSSSGLLDMFIYTFVYRYVYHYVYILEYICIEINI
jgi:hypothetical protein